MGGCDAATDEDLMARALELARRGEGWVEPNPMVGCVVAKQGRIIGQGWHRQFGEPHAEVNALADASALGELRGATAYVTLEPCCYQGKTPPCTEALVQSGVARVVIAAKDPNPKINGRGIERLREVGVEVTVGVLADQANRLLEPFRKWTTRRRPWVLAKWAMSLDGKIATHTGSSRWISGPESRAIVHTLRGRVDAIVVGRGSAQTDDPLLTARPSGPRTATRIVLDSRARLSSDSQLVKTIGQAPVLVAAGTNAADEDCQRLTREGVDVVRLEACDRAAQIDELLKLLAGRDMTNVLFEGGAGVFGALLDQGAVDEVHAFVAPQLIGGAKAPGAIAGLGMASVRSAYRLSEVSVRQTGDDIYVQGRIKP